ncbi:MAG: prolipoprotein diacylglyceryl transferase [Myxococcota bacterium]
MAPVLSVFGLPLPSYAVMMMVGYVAALLMVLGLSRRAPGVDRAQVVDLFIVMLVSSVIGAKLGHVLFEAPGHVAADGHVIESLPELLREDPLHVLRLGEGGYVWYGGMIGALLMAVFYFRRRPQLNALLYSDLFAPAVMVGAAFGRMGCLMAGCCYGVPTELPWGMAFPATEGQLVHPTQLYDATFAALLGAGLAWAFARRHFDGQIIAVLLLLYPLARFSTEVFRGDPERGTVGPGSTSQALSVLVFLAGLWLYGWARRRHAQASQGAQAELRPMSL